MARRWAFFGVLGALADSADRAFDSAQAGGFRFVWAFLPEPAVARKLPFQHVVLSRFLSTAGQESLAFGTLVAVAREDGSAFELALIGVAALAPPTLLGMYGGAIADQLPKRIALAGAYTSQAALCLTVPFLLGTSLPVVIVLIFLVGVLGQVSSPAEKSVLPLVSSEGELASAVSVINLAGGAGSGFGMAVLAPIIVRTAGLDVVFYVAGIFLLLAATRVFDLQVLDREWSGKLVPSELRVRPAIAWVTRHRAVAAIVLLAVLAGTVNHVLSFLAPRYVEEVLSADAADTAFVLLPSSIGVVAGLLLAPRIMRLRGERVAALAGLFIGTTFLTLFGVVDAVATVVDPVNPLRLLGIAGLSTNEQLRTASLLSLPLSFGVSLTATSAQTYINRRVPLVLQGRVFAIQSTLRHGSAMIPLLILGSAATQFGADTVLLASPVILFFLAVVLLQLSFRAAEREPPSYLEVASSFWDRSDLER